MQSDTQTFGFEKALEIAKNGGKVARLSFRDTCYVVVQKPTETSKMTKPYLAMYKKVNDLENPTVERYDIFPVDLSCESIFAEDWYQIHEVASETAAERDLNKGTE